MSTDILSVKPYASTTPRASAAQANTVFITDPPALHVRVTNPETAETIGIELDVADRYLVIGETTSALTITWLLPTDGNVFFDNPPLYFTSGNPGATVTRVSGSEVRVTWPPNPENGPNGGTSFYYRLAAVARFGETLVPITHDPTVHNDPPTE
jgi:hypothetical protein